ncbi:SPOSA6832_00623 [Sporobolomyces salmonicolor]|uniref:SPOSA6832_00623-mRNA-1:cds n=1 Tax=Sporidiobolus salmonicolor TaxID=5005 RepID=A0A0D6EH26_SPOSA|nr:SPOSA6832_00623 [Sporobolomyces salmonicolor]
MASVFLTLFFLAMIIHLVQLIKFRRYWFMGTMVVGCALEAVGWSLRLYGHKHVASRSPYIAQLALLVIAPTFFSAALYWALAIIFALVAPTKSFLSTKWFKIIFISSDFVALVVQAVGGGMAGAAGDDMKKLNTDSKNAVSPFPLSIADSSVAAFQIALQLAVMTLYAAYGIYWTCRARLQVKLAGPKTQVMLGALLLASCAIIVRNVQPFMPWIPHGRAPPGLPRQTCGEPGSSSRLHAVRLRTLTPRALSLPGDTTHDALRRRSHRFRNLAPHPCSPLHLIESVIHPHWFLVTAPTVQPVADDEKATNASTTVVPVQPTNAASQESVKL